jgi:hypothetical protein
MPSALAYPAPTAPTWMSHLARLAFVIKVDGIKARFKPAYTSANRKGKFP